MHANIDSGKVLEQKNNQESKNVTCSIIDLSDQSESENSWIKLHQMFDR